MDDGGIKHHRGVVCPSVSNESVTQGRLPHVHHFWVEDDGLLSLLAVRGMNPRVVSVMGARAACIDVVAHEIVARGGAFYIDGGQKGHPVNGVRGRITVQVFGIIDISSNGDFSVTRCVDGPVHRIPFEARFLERVRVRSIQMNTFRLNGASVGIVSQRRQPSVSDPIHRLNEFELIRVLVSTSVDEGGTSGHRMSLIQANNRLVVVPFSREPIGHHLGPDFRSVIFDQRAQWRLVKAGSIRVFGEGIS